MDWENEDPTMNTTLEAAAPSSPRGAPRADECTRPVVLLLNRVAFMGGVERVIVTAMEQLHARGFDPVLACPGTGELPDAVRAAGFRVEPIAFDRMRATLDPRALFRYARSLRRASAEVRDVCIRLGVRVLHAHHPVAAAYAVRAVRELDIPLVMHVHETPPAPTLYRIAMRYSAPHARRFICVSEAARALLDEIGIARERSAVVYNGVHPGFLAAPPAAAPDVTGPGPHVGVFGVIEPRKAQHVFLEAASSLARRYPDAQFWVVGPVAFADDEAYAARLRELAGAPGLAGRVHFTGYRADVAPMMMAMDVVVLSSVAYDALPTVCIEALALGRRLVATRVGGVPEIVRDQQTGMIVPPHDPAAIAEAVEALLALAPGDPMQSAAREDIRTRFSPERFGRDLAQALHAALESSVN